MRLRSMLSMGACAAGALVLYAGATPAFAKDGPLPGRHDVQVKPADMNAGLNNGSTQRGQVNSTQIDNTEQAVVRGITIQMNVVGHGYPKMQMNNLNDSGANHNKPQQRSTQSASKVEINKDDSYPTQGEIERLVRNKAGSPK